MNTTQTELLDLLKISDKTRDSHWENKFLDSFPGAKATLLSSHPQLGPDNFPYMFIEIKDDSQEPIHTLLQWISENGVGLAVNPTKNFPDFVFTYGMTWNFIKNGRFLTPSSQSDISKDNQSHSIFAGTPSEAYLPKHVREIIKEFLKQQGVLSPKIIMLSPDEKNFDLCFSIESFGNPPEKEHQGILQALSWFLPAHYSLAFVSEDGLPEFQSL